MYTLALYRTYLQSWLTIVHNSVALNQSQSMLVTQDIVRGARALSGSVCAGANNRRLKILPYHY